MNFRSLLFTAFAVTPLSLSAVDGITGTDSLSLGLGYAWSNEPDVGFSGFVTEVVGRKNIVAGAPHGLDLLAGLEYSSVSYDDVDADTTAWTGYAGLVYYYDNQGPLVPFFTAQAGYARANMVGDTEDSFAYRIGAGVEFYVTKGFSVVPQVLLIETPDVSTDTTTEYSLTLNFWFAEKSGLYARTTYQTTDASDAGSLLMGYIGSF